MGVEAVDDQIRRKWLSPKALKGHPELFPATPSCDRIDKAIALADEQGRDLSAMRLTMTKDTANAMVAELIGDDLPCVPLDYQGIPVVIGRTNGLGPR